MTSKIFWFWVPVIALCVQIVLEITLPHEILSPLHSENGPHELLQFLAISLAAIAALRLLMMPEVRANKYLLAWIVIAFVACVYVSGEEMSWGQQVFKWNSSEFWMEVNDQGETNLHNTSSWLDQKPRLLLIIGVIVGGVVMPLLRKFKPGTLPEKFNIIYPTNHVIPTSVVVVFLVVIDHIDKMMKDVHLFERISEVEELYLFYFVLMYLVILRGKLLGKV